MKEVIAEDDEYCCYNIDFCFPFAHNLSLREIKEDLIEREYIKTGLNSMILDMTLEVMTKMDITDLDSINKGMINLDSI